MTGSRSTGVDEALVNRIKEVLIDDTVTLDQIHVDKPPAGSLGGSRTGETLELLMNLATERINSTLAQTTNAVVDLVDGLTDAANAIKNADDEAAVNATKLMNNGVDTINQPFFENLAKDTRLNLPDINLPFLPDLGAVEEAVTRGKFGQDEAGE